MNKSFLQNRSPPPPCRVLNKYISPAILPGGGFTDWGQVGMEEDNHDNLREYILTILPDVGLTDCRQVGVQEDYHDNLREYILVTLSDGNLTNWR